MFRLDGRVALVTGSGFGAGAGRTGGARIGFGIASALAAQGAAVVINDIDAARVETAVAEIRSAGGKATGVVFDVTDFASVESGFKQAGEAFGPVSVLVNNAGLHGASTMSLRPFMEYQPSEWRAPIDANLYGTLNCTRAALPAMLAAGWGRIIYISSDAGRIWPTSGLTASLYAAAKAGGAHFMRHLAFEVGRKGVTCNVISTGLMAGSAPAELEATELRTIPATRLGNRNDIAAAAVFFASNEAEWINAQTLPVNGGAAAS